MDFSIHFFFTFEKLPDVPEDLRCLSLLTIQFTIYIITTIMGGAFLYLNQGYKDGQCRMQYRLWSPTLMQSLYRDIGLYKQYWHDLTSAGCSCCAPVLTVKHDCSVTAHSSNSAIAINCIITLVLDFSIEVNIVFIIFQQLNWAAVCSGVWCWLRCQVKGLRFLWDVWGHCAAWLDAAV